MTDIFLMRCTPDVCSTSWIVTRKLVKVLVLICQIHRHLLRFLEEAACKYNIEDYNKKVNKLKEKSKRAHQLLLYYKPEIWANTFFPGIRHLFYDHYLLFFVHLSSYTMSTLYKTIHLLYNFVHILCNFVLLNLIFSTISDFLSTFVLFCQIWTYYF